MTSTHWKHKEVVQMYCELCKRNLTDYEILVFLLTGFEENKT